MDAPKPIVLCLVAEIDPTVSVIRSRHSPHDRPISMV